MDKEERCPVFGETIRNDYSGYVLFISFLRIFKMTFRSMRPKHSLAFLSAVLLLLSLLFAPNALAVKRILLVGDSWAQWPWKMHSFQTVLNSNFGAGVYEVEGTYTALGGTTANSWATNAVPPEDTFPSPPGYSNMPSLDRITWSLNKWPTIDIIHLSISGNDMWAWRADWTPAQTQALYDTIRNDVHAVVNWIRTNHPHVKILLCGYDYLNITETCTYGMQEFSWGSAILANTLGFSVGDFDQNRANNHQINLFFAGLGPRLVSLAQGINRLEYVQNWGNIQWRVGYKNSAGQIWGAHTVPFPGMAPDYNPMPGGDVSWGTPSFYMNKTDGNQRDAIHLSNDGYKLLFDNCLMQYYAGWLTDTTGPAVASITRNQPSPTALNQVSFTVLFNEAVRGVTVADFVLAGTATSGAVITGIAGAEDTNARVVTVDISGAPNGTLRLDLIDEGRIFDKYLNELGGDGVGNGNFNGGESYLIDRGDPVPVITADIPEPSLLDTVPFTVKFNKAVTGFVASDIALQVKSGAGTAHVVNFAGSGDQYSFGVMVTRSEPITVGISVPAGVCQDASNRPNLAGQYTDGADNAYAFNYVSGPVAPGDLYVSDGSLGELVLTSGMALSINTGSTPPGFQINGGAPVFGQVFSATNGDVAKFNFSRVVVPAGVTVSVTGNRPLVLAASGDMYWDSAIDVSGTVPGRAGGGTGGSGGAGGAGVSGGAGGSSANGGAVAAGGAGSPSPSTDYGNGLGVGATGTAGKPGGGGANGAVGAAGKVGAAGSAGTTGFGSQGSGGSAGTPGSAGNPVAQNNGGSADPGGAPGGGGGPWRYGNEGQPADAGWGVAATGTGGNAVAGQSGGNGGGGNAGGNAALTIAADALLLAAGNGGGGGAGGAGGTGGASQTGGTGGVGGTGGGAVVLAARGLLSFGGAVDISSGAPASGSAGKSAQAGTPGTDPGNNGAGGAPGNGGLTGTWWLSFYGCHVNYVNGGTGGAGGAGARGGVGGVGGTSGASGGGGTGGLGTPGVVKLHGSGVLAGAGTVLCQNHTGGTDAGLRGRATIISNLAAPAAPAFTDDFFLGQTTNNGWLRSSAPYAPALQIPLLPQLEGGLATGGFVLPGFWNESAYQAAHTGIPRLELVALRGGASPFLDFDQIFIVNNGIDEVTDVTLFVSGNPYALGALPAGAVWTTTVPSGAVLVLSSSLEINFAESDRFAYTGQAVQLSAATEGGVAPFTWTWKKDGTVVQTGGADTYEIASLSLSDAGVYTVEVEDALNQTAVTLQGCRVHAAAPLSVVQAPVSATVPDGGNHVFTVEVSGGHGTLLYDWRKGGVSLGAPSRAWLSLDAVDATYAGAYDVVVSDSVGVAPEGLVTTPVPAADLSISYPLTVTEPDDVTLYEDAAQAVFEVTASGGVPPYNYVWQRNGSALAPAEQPNSGQLVLNAPLNSKAGAYRCVVTDSALPPDSETSAAGQLRVYPRLAFTKQPQGGTFLVNTTLTLQAQVSGGILPYTFVWRKDGAALPVALQPQSGTLVIPSLQYTDAGSYDVVVYDSVTEMLVSAGALVDVVDSMPLTFIRQPESGTVSAGQPFFFEVEAAGGSGALTYQWYFSNGVAPYAPVGTNAARLDIAQAGRQHSGSYYVEVRDASDSINSIPATLFVSLTITSQPQGGSVAEGGTFTLSVQAGGGAGTLNYQWKREALDKSAVPVGTNDPVYQILNASAEDEGRYWVEISDSDTTITSGSVEVLVVTAAVPAYSYALLAVLVLFIALLGSRAFLRPNRI